MTRILSNTPTGHNMNIPSSYNGSLESMNITTNVSDDFNELFSNLMISDWTLMNQGALVVVLDMSLAIISVVFNLMVITALKEKEHMLGVTFNLMLLNLCSSNLLSAVMVKSISIVHNAYAVAANSTQSDIAFCILYSFGYRLTWAVLPWSIVVLSWLTVMPRYRRLQAPTTFTSVLPSVSGSLDCDPVEAIQLYATQQGTCSSNIGGSVMDSVEEKYNEGEEPVYAGLTMFDKGILGFIWGVSFIYGVLTEQILSKKIDVPCSVSDHLSENFGIASIVLAIIFPTIIGPVIVTILHISFSIMNIILKNPPLAANNKRDEIQNIFCIFLLTIIFLFTYITSMIICEFFLNTSNNLLYFVILKYIVGTSHHLFGPICILISRRDIWISAIQVYKKGGTTQSKSFEITAEEMQKELGLGVNP